MGILPKHTPTPWEVRERSPLQPLEIIGYIEQIDLEFFKKVRMLDHIAVVDDSPRDLANAKFMVSCVNEHESLLMALRDCVTAIDSAMRYDDLHTGGQQGLADACAKAREVLDMADREKRP